MSMLILSRYIRMHKSSMLLCVFLTGLGTYLWRATGTMPPAIRCIIGNVLSETTRTQLKAHIMQQHAQSVKPRELIKNLKNSFLWIKDTTLSIQPNLVTITLNTDLPSLLINDRLVVTKDGNAFEKEIFSHKSIALLPTLTVNPLVLNNPHNLKEIALFMHQLPEGTLSFYSITWKNEHTIYLTDKTHKNFVLITSTDRPLSAQKLYTGLCIKQTVHTQLVKKPTDQWTADMRFTDTIIVTKRGNTYGTHVS